MPGSMLNKMGRGMCVMCKGIVELLLMLRWKKISQQVFCSYNRPGIKR